MNNIVIDKLVLGTAQLGQRYGITNMVGKPTKKEVFSILTFAWEKGIRQFDTSPSYQSESLLGEFFSAHGIRNEVVVHTKIPPTNDDGRYTREIIDSINSSLDKLGCAIGVLFFHDSASSRLLLKYRELFSSILKDWPVCTLGLSVYEAHEVYDSTTCGFELAYQFPFNVLDRRFCSVEMLTGKRYARSIFLQGLLAYGGFPRPDMNPELRNIGAQYHAILSDNGWNPINFALSFANNSENIDYMVVGVECVGQLEEIISLELYDAMITSNVNFDQTIPYGKWIDPRQWS